MFPQSGLKNVSCSLEINDRVPLFPKKPREALIDTQMPEFKALTMAPSVLACNYSTRFFVPFYKITRIFSSAIPYMSCDAVSLIYWEMDLKLFVPNLATTAQLILFGWKKCWQVLV